MSGGINTGGGTYAGSVNTAGGQFVGRDQIRVGKVIQVIVNVPASGDGRAGPGARDEPGLERQLRRIADLLKGQDQQLDRLGVEAGIAAPPALPPGLPSSGGAAATAWSALGSTAVAPKTLSGADASQLASSFSEASAQLSQVDRQLAAPVVELAVGEQRLNVVDLLVRQGNLALWRFRQAAYRLSSEQVTADFLARLEWPSPPDVRALNAQARTNVEILRGLALGQMVGLLLGGQPGVLGYATDQVLQGRWAAVLDGLRANGTIDAETAMQIRTQLEAFGHPYRPQDVSAAVQDAELALGQALAREPQNTAAMVNLATVRAESALFTYIATGTADRDRLTSAHSLFAQARDLLSRRTDPAGRGELARCRLYASMALPPHANLDSVPLAAMFIQLTAAAYSRAARAGIRWDVVQRSMARGSVDFVDRSGIAEAQTLFASVGETALASQCGQMLQQIDSTAARRAAMSQWIQLARPIVGSWTYRGGNMYTAASGMIVFDAEGAFHWLADAGPMPGVVAERNICVGSYQIMNNTIGLQGSRWPMPPPQGNWMPAPLAAMPPAPFTLQIVIQNWNAEQLYLLTPQDGIQVQCQRL